jgi:hypothetical protein
VKKRDKYLLAGAIALLVFVNRKKLFASEATPVLAPDDGKELANVLKLAKPA